MKLVLLSLLYWSYIRLSASFPVEEKPGFTPWSLAKRAEIEGTVFSGTLGAPLGVFGVADDTCDGKMGSPGCWNMLDVTVDKMIEHRAEKTKTNCAPCLFYTQYLSGAAEREANFVLREAMLFNALEDGRRFQTIWDLHDKEYYPEDHLLLETPGVRCIWNDYKDNDWKTKRPSCRRAYFKAMSKAMAMECRGEVFVMTMTNLENNEKVPQDGIWWEVEFPTLIDLNRAPEKKVDKITYLQVPFKTEKQIKALKEVSLERRRPPRIDVEAEYWPNGPGARQLRDVQAGSQGTASTAKEKRSPDTSGFVERGDEETDANEGRDDKEVLDPTDLEYPYAHDINDMYEWYKDIAW